MNQEEFLQIVQANTRARKCSGSAKEITKRG